MLALVDLRKAVRCSLQQSVDTTQKNSLVEDWLRPVDGGYTGAVAMVELIHPPDPQGLLPPILACLPTAFASRRPPPALLPLISPILRQRLQLISDPSDNWLRLLCWDRSKAETLKEQIEEATFEPHPVSGEIEIGDVDAITYKRVDEETLRAQIRLEEWPFAPIFLWCTGGEDGNGWKLAEVLPYPEIDDSWSATIQQANETSSSRIVNEALLAAGSGPGRPGSNLSVPKTDEDDYWAMYDDTPGRTPARKPSIQQGGGPSEDEYYSRYGDVQPAMDGHDPDEEMKDGVQSTLNGHALRNAQSAEQPSPPPYQEDAMDGDHDEKDVEVRQPVPTSPSSRAGSETIARLEDSAERFNASEVGIRQHISTSMKSMYRLAKSAGLDREEFDRIVTRELEALSIFDRDE